MDSRRITAILSVLMLSLMGISVPFGTDVSGENQGTVSSDGIVVTYVDSAKEGYGIMSVSFSVDTGDDEFTISIDGKRSAPIGINQGMFIVPGLSEGKHSLAVECGDKVWNLTMVVSGVIHATGIELDPSSISMIVGGTYALKATILPTDAVEKDVVWTTSDPSVATVSGGVVTAVSVGSATITASVGTLSDVCVVSVNEPPHTHSWGSGTVTKAATCTESGIRTYTCSCGETRTETILASGHQWSAWTVTKEATTSENGIKERSCSVCGQKEQQSFPYDGHTHSWDSGTVTKAATCTESGIRTYTCSCGETRTETILASGHQWSAWTVTKEATTSEDGLKERFCSVCGQKETSSIAKIVIVDNDDGTKTKTEEESDGTVVHTTTGSEDGSTKVEKTREDVDGSGNRVTMNSSETIDKDGNSVSSEKKVEAESADGNAIASTKVVDGADKADIITVMKVESSVVSKERIEQAIVIQQKVSDEIGKDVKEQTKTILVESTSSDAVFTVAQDAVKVASDSGSSLKIASTKGSVAVSDQVLSNISKEGEITISITEAKDRDMNDSQKTAVAGGVVVDVKILTDGKDLGKVLGGTITITIKHTPAAGKVAVVYYVDDNGVRERMQDVVYHSDVGEVSFNTTHCSLYVVVDEGEDSGASDGSNVLLYAGIGIVVLIAILSAALVIKRRS